ncbi:MAG: hypothetical protein KDC56_11610, partial [Flavobacteriaceae bacterium]|nr:hypothetical protein [Flavobacteriaceae bacterium]
MTADKLIVTGALGHISGAIFHAVLPKRIERDQLQLSHLFPLYFQYTEINRCLIKKDILVFVIFNSVGVLMHAFSYAGFKEPFFVNEQANFFLNFP